MRYWLTRAAELAVMSIGVGIFLSILIAFGEVHP